MREQEGGRCGSGNASVARGCRLPFRSANKATETVGTERLWQVQLVRNPASTESVIVSIRELDCAGRGRSCVWPPINGLASIAGHETLSNGLRREC